MKKYWILGLILGCSMVSHALVSDGFKCAMEIKDKTSAASTRQKMEFFIARLPLSASPAPDVRLTAGFSYQSLSLETKKAKLGAYLHFYYKHAVKLDANYTPIEARQLTCIDLATSHCPKGHGNGDDEIDICKDLSLTSCAEPRDPFDKDNGWARTTLIDGEPSFNEQSREIVTSIKDEKGTEVGTAKLTCQYTGSYK